MQDKIKQVEACLEADVLREIRETAQKVIHSFGEWHETQIAHAWALATIQVLVRRQIVVPLQVQGSDK